jgi:radical SAM-linked protein
VLKRLREGRKPGFTFAPEAGSDRLRKVINKGITGDEILDMTEQVFMAGWDTLKLYFMIGLPTEKEEDLLEICRLVREMSLTGKRILKKKPRFNITISPFVPKPHTPFQWLPQETIETLKQKQAFLQRKLSNSLVRLKCHTSELSFIEAVLARGDRRISKVLKQTWELGARFDQWGEHFNFSLWVDAFKKTGIDPSFYAYRRRTLDEVFPWSHLFMGVDEGFLKHEYGKALEEEETPDCRVAGCHNCGACGPDLRSGVDQIWVRSLKNGDDRENIVPLSKPISPFMKPDLKLGQTKLRVRFKFSKKGQAVFFSHLDFIRIIGLAVRRAKIQVAYSQGFHPTPRISFGPALPVGMEGLAEYMDMDLTQEKTTEELVKILNCQLPHGISILEAKKIPCKARSLMSLISEAQYHVFLPNRIIEDFGSFPHHLDLIKKTMKKTTIRYLRERKNGQKEIDIRPFIKEINCIKKENSFEVFLRLKVTTNQNVRPREVLEAVYGKMAKEWNGLIRISREGLFSSYENEDEVHANKDNNNSGIRDPIYLV